ncbi:MAG TPA: CSLREA domain-containing protein, partial [Gaiellaceae bacterium]|nr:CSLREA domain-containing protein [Gaiellaceae bacterium]
MRRLAVVGATVLLAAVLVPQAFAGGPYEVNVGDDSTNATSTCALGDSNPCSLRDAITRANANSGGDIGFTGSIGTIQIAGLLPSIVEPVAIDGATGSSGHVTIVGGPGIGAGLDLGAGSDASKLANLTVMGFTDGPGVSIVSDDNTLHADTFSGNKIGVEVKQASGNSIGLNNQSTADTNNISKNSVSEIAITGAAGQLASGNNVYNTNVGSVAIGVPGAATAAQDGIDLVYAPNTTILRNDIGGHSGAAVSIDANSPGFAVTANQIGVIGSNVHYGNGTGVRTFSTGVVGTSSGFVGNTMSYNTGAAIEVDTDGVTILGNSIVSNGKGIDKSAINETPSPISVVSATQASGSISAVIEAPGLSDPDNAPATVELFVSDSCEPGGVGQTLFKSISTSVQGGSVDVQTSGANPDPNATVMTATVTTPGGTSEFSACQTISGGPGTTFTVNSPVDDASHACNASECTLREAINAANALGGHNTIVFDLAGPGIPKITIDESGGGLGDLPAITSPITIDGSNLGVTPGVEITSSVVADPTPPNPVLAVGTGLDVTAGSSTIRGLIIHGFNTQLVLGSNGENKVVGNWIGIEPDGLTSLDDPNGIQLNDSGRNTIGGTTAADRNVITSVQGIAIGSPGSNVVEGNYIGLDTTGNTAPSGPGTGVGIQVTGGDTNTIGAPGAGNHIWAFQQGIDLSGTTNNTVAGNSVGTTADESIDIPDGDTGIQIDSAASGNEIGGATVAAGNVLAALGDVGLLIQAGGNTMEGNFIGASRTGVPYADTNHQGIRQLGSNGPNTYRNNVIDSSSDLGFELDDGDNTQIVGNTFRRNNHTPIFVSLGLTGV